MKIIISATAKDWSALLDERFGRAKGFILYDETKDTFSWHPNKEGLNSSHGAGVVAAQFVINTGASVILTGHIGPKAFNILNKAGIKVFNSEVASLNEVYNDFKHGKLILQKE